MNRTRSLTEGDPLKLILRFALPLLLGNLIQQTYNVVDSAIVGQTLGSKALAAVGDSSSVQFMVLGFCTGTMTGFGIPVAASFGARDEESMRRYVYNGAILTGILGAAVTLLTTLLTSSILRILKTPEEIFSDAYQYLFIIFCGIPATLLYNYLSSVLRAVGDSRTPFVFLAFSSILNIFLDLFCIKILRWGVAGAAAATVVSQLVSGLLCLRLIRRKYEILHIPPEERHFEGAESRHLLNMGIPMGLQFSITAIGSMVMQMSNNSLGTLYVSAFAAAIKIKSFTMSPFDALGAAVSTFLSQNLGAGKTDRIRTGIHIGERAAVAYGAACGLILILFGRNLSLIFLSPEETEILDASAKYLRYLGYFYWALGILVVTRMSIQGLGYSQRAMLAGFVEMAARTLVCLLLTGKIGYTAICIADQSAWLSALVYLIPTLVWTVKRIEKQLAAVPAADR